MKFPREWEQVGDCLMAIARADHLKIMVPFAFRKEGRWYLMPYIRA